MLISLYSGVPAWVIVPQRVRPARAAGLQGPLAFEGTIHSHLLPTDLWTRIRSEWERHCFARVTQEQGRSLLAAAMRRFGTLAPPFSGAQTAKPSPRVGRRCYSTGGKRNGAT